MEKKVFESFNNYIVNEITVSKDAKTKNIQLLVDEAKDQIKQAGANGQHSLIINIFAPDYQIGEAVFDILKAEDLIKIQVQGKATRRTGSGYEYNVSCDILDSKLINKKALKKAQNDAIKSALAQAQAAADNGSSFVTISFDLPDFNYTIVRNELKEEGVYIVSGGAHMDKNYDGSYSFSLSCEIK